MVGSEGEAVEEDHFVGGEDSDVLRDERPAREAEVSCEGRAVVRGIEASRIGGLVVLSVGITLSNASACGVAINARLRKATEFPEVRFDEDEVGSSLDTV